MERKKHIMWDSILCGSFATLNKWFNLDPGYPRTLSCIWKYSSRIAGY